MVRSLFLLYLLNGKTTLKLFKFCEDKEKKYEKTFDSVFKPIENALAPLDYAQKTARHLAFSYPYTPYHNVFLKV